MHIPPFLIAGLLALLFTYAIAYEMRWVAQGLGAMAPPGGRHIHTHPVPRLGGLAILDRKSTRLNSSHTVISYAVFCLIKKTDKLDAEKWVSTLDTFCN